jgi:hypothetical protein
MSASVSRFSTLGARLDAAWAGIRGRAMDVRAFLTGADTDDREAVRLTAAYAQSPWAFAAVNFITGELSGRPLKFYQGEQEYADAAFNAWWEAPAWGVDSVGQRQRLTRSTVVRDLAAWAKLEGEFIIALDDEWLLATASRAAARLSPFLILEPDRTRLIVRGGVLQGYEHVDTAGRRRVFVPEQVYHWKAFNPYDPWRGLGAQQVAKVATEGAFLTGIYIRDLMRNNGDQGFIVVGKSGVADDNQRDQIVADLRAKRAALKRGIAKDLFVTGDIGIERPPERSISAEIVNGKGSMAQEIFTAYCVPPSMAEAKTNYSMGKDSDRYQLITSNCMPLGGEICGVFAQISTRMTGRVLTAELDWDDHPVMVEVRFARVETGLRLWGAGMPLKHASDYLDLGMPAFPGWDIGYLPFSVMPVSAEGSTPPESSPTADPALQEPKRRTLPEISTLTALIAARSKVNASRSRELQVETETLRAFTCNCGEGCIEQKADRPAAEIARWREHMRLRRDTVGAFKSAFGRVLMTARIETLRKIEAQSDKAMQAKRAAVDFNAKTAATDFLFDLTKFTGEFKAAMRKQQTVALDKAGTELLKELGKDDPFHHAPAKVLHYLSRRENKLAGVPQASWDRVRDSLAEGYEAGETTAQLAARARKVFTHLNDAEGLRIAQSETSAAYGTGRHEAMREAGVQYKAWLTSGNDNVREAHRLAGLTYSPDTPIALDEPFVVDGEELMHPGDDSGSPGNTINCHCIQLAVANPNT